MYRDDSIVPRPAFAITACVMLWALSVLPGLNSVGLINWQESARALAASEMNTRGDWIVPTIAGEPYLAKPPMLYWCHLSLSAAIGRTPGEHELRLTVALAGLAGILLTYWAARSLTARAETDSAEHPTAPRHDPQAAAFWAATFLATGILYVRSSRIGELDIVLAPFTVAAVWGAAWAWMNPRSAVWRRTLAIVVSAIACGGAALTKGPPALAVIVLAVAGGIAAASAIEHGRHLSRRASCLAAIVGFATTLAVSLAIGSGSLSSASTWAASGLLSLGAAVLGIMVARWCTRAAVAATLSGWWRSGWPLAVLAGFFCLWMWTRAVEDRIGPGAMTQAAAREASDNLRWFDPAGPIQSLEAMTYGAGAGSFAALAALFWLITRRVRLSRGWWISIAWIGLGLMLFSVSGRGSGRYLTPLWPGVCLLGGLWLARAVADSPRGRVLATTAAITTLVLAASQAWWYTSKRAAAEGTRSPRDFIAELRKQPSVDPERLAVVDFWIGSLNYYAGSPVEPILDQGPWIDYPHRVTPLAEFVERLRADGGECVVLVRGTWPGDQAPPGGVPATSPADHLSRMGLVLDEIPLKAPFRVDRNRTPVKAFRARAGTPDS